MVLHMIHDHARDLGNEWRQVGGLEMQGTATRAAIVGVRVYFVGGEGEGVHPCPARQRSPLHHKNIDLQ